MEILELKSTPEKKKKQKTPPSVDVLYSRLERVGERIIKLEHRMMEMT